MAGWLSRLLGGWRRRPPQRRRWTQLAATASALPVAECAALADEARRLRGDLDLFLLAARRYPVAAPRDLPAGTDWSWRPLPFQAPLPGRGLAAPASGAMLAPGLAVWHDLPDAPLVVAQHPVGLCGDLPPFALTIESFAAHDQGYVALSIDLPQSALAGLDNSFILHVSAVISAESPVSTYLRLNIEHGPDTEQMQNPFGIVGPGEALRAPAGFDLGLVPMNPQRLAKIWLDVIVEKPGANLVHLHDLVISRHRRADM